MYLRHRLTKVCILHQISLLTSQNIRLVLNNSFPSPENRVVYDKMWGKYGTAGQVTDDNTAHAHCMLGT
jgi:hypothetical protein